MVKFIEQYAPLEQRSVAATAYGGSAEVLQYFIDKGFTLDDPTICTTALPYGYTAYVKLAIKHGAPTLGSTLMVDAVRTNEIEVIKLLRAKGCE